MYAERTTDPDRSQNRGEQFRGEMPLNVVSDHPATETISAMNAAARSMLVYSIYSFGLGATLLLIPNVPLPLFGLPQATEVWIRVAGMTVIFLATFFYIAARNDYREIIAASVATRIAVPFVFAALALAGYTSWNILLFTPFDVLFALWTWSSLRRSPVAA